jgi:hypothetical protein
VQYVMQGVIIAVGMSARAFAPRLRTNRTSGTRPDADGVRDGADSRHSVETS